MLTFPKCDAATLWGTYFSLIWYKVVKVVLKSDVVLITEISVFRMRERSSDSLAAMARLIGIASIPCQGETQSDESTVFSEDSKLGWGGGEGVLASFLPGGRIGIFRI